MPDLSAKQIGAMQSLLQRICPNLGLAFSEQVNQEVVLDLLEVQSVSLSELLSRSDNALQTQFTLSRPEGSESVFLVSEETARILVNLLEGLQADDLAEALSDSQIDTLSTAMTGLVRGFAISLSNLTGESYDLESSSTHVGMLTVPPVFALEGSAVEARFSLSIPGVLAAELTGLFTTTLMSEIVPPSDARTTPATSPTIESMLGEDDVAAMLNQVTGAGADFGPDPGPSTGRAQDTGGPIPFPNLLGGGSEMTLPRGLDMILDIPLDVTVELGRVRMLIKDVLELSSGSIIELDRIAGEPVDLLVNGRLVAKGEVVVIEDNFGIRITEITTPAERLAGLGKGR